MLEATDDNTIHAARQECMQVCPEFCIPIAEHFEFLNQEFSFEGPVFKHVSRECWVTFEKQDVEIKVGYEPYTLPWGHITQSDEMKSIDDLMSQYGFQLDEVKYREYDQT